MKKLEEQIILDEIEERAETYGYYLTMEEIVGEKYHEDRRISEEISVAIENLAKNIGISGGKISEIADRGFEEGIKAAKWDCKFTRYLKEE